MTTLNERIERFLERARARQARPAPPEPAPVPADVEASANQIRAALSGAFGEAIQVAVGETGEDAGAFFAAVPAAHIKASGLRFVETACPPRLGNRDRGTLARVPVGGAEARQNAANRVAKPLGEGWKVAVDSFSCHEAAVDVVIFRVERA